MERAGGDSFDRRLIDPAVLLVGADAQLHAALAPALAHHNIFVETASVAQVTDAAVAAAPDLILLVGDAAAGDCGAEVVQRLAASPLTAVMPVVVLEDRPELATRLQAFRHGAAAVIARSASVDAIAAQVAEFARNAPQRAAGAFGQVGEATLREFTEALAQQLRSGILSVRGAGGTDDDAVRLVLGAGRPLSGVIEEFVQRVKDHVVSAEPLRYEFAEFATGTVGVLGDTSDQPSPAAADVQGVTVLLADEHAARADAVAQELRKHGATVVVTDFEPTPRRWTGLRQLNPTVLIIGSDPVQGRGYELVRQMRADLRMRWASLLVVDWQEVWPDQVVVPSLERLLGPIRALIEADCQIRDRARQGRSIGIRLEAVGPTRLLRALLDADRSVRLTVHDPPVRVTVDLAPGLVVGASSQNLLVPSEKQEGAAALAVLLGFSSGRAHVEHVAQPASANLMATLDVALDMADTERRSLAPPHSAGAAADPVQSRRVDAERAVSGSIVRRVAARAKAAGVRVARSQRGARLLLWSAPVVAVGLLAMAAALAWRGPTSPAARATHAAAAAASGAVSASGDQAQPDRPLTSPSATASRPPPAQPAALHVEQRTASAPTCEALLVDEPHRADGLTPMALHSQLGLAREALVLGKMDEAQRFYCRAARYAPQHTAALVGVTRVLLLRRDGPAAEQWARRAVTARPDNPDLRALLGDALALAGKHEEAREAWLAATGVDGRDHEALAKLGRRYRQVAGGALKRRVPRRAERYYRRAVLLRPTDVPATLGLVMSLLQGGETDSALHWARRAVTLAPENAEARVLLGDILDKRGDGAAAQEQWRRAARLDPTHPEARHRLLRVESRKPTW